MLQKSITFAKIGRLYAAGIHLALENNAKLPD